MILPRGLTVQRRLEKLFAVHRSLTAGKSKANLVFLVRKK